MKRLYEALYKYPGKGYYSAHMPGHKGHIDDGFLKEALRYDITEIDGFDNLHDAKGLIAESEKYAADLYGSSETHYLVGGSTSGILSAILGVTKPGGKIIAARNCHRSVYNAVCEGRLECRYLYPEYMKGPGILGGISPYSVEEAIKKDPDAAAVVITSPTYEGVCSDIREIAGICHRYEKILITDGAHGAHFGFDDRFPRSAVREGSDIVIHSVHKTLPSPTQTALLHINGELVNRDRIRRKLKIYQSSSPSYLLMAGIDYCMTIIGDGGSDLFNDFYLRTCKLSEGLKDLKCLRHISRNMLCSLEGIYDADPGKLIISTNGAGITGRELYDILRKEYRIQPEMATDEHCLLILTIMDTQEGFERIENAIKCIDEKLFEKNGCRSMSADPDICVYGLYSREAREAVPLYEAVDADSHILGLDHAAGCISAGFISLYPPGIPLLVPGEEIEEEHIGIIEKALDMGLNIQGLSNENEMEIQVL